MNRTETIKLLAVINGAYPRFEIKSESANLMIDLWQSTFKDIPADEMAQALKEMIKELKYPPTIADFWNKVGNHNLIGGKMELIDLWNEALESVGKAKGYIESISEDYEESVEFDEETRSCKIKRIKTGDNAEKALEVYDKLSSENKRYFGSCDNFLKIAEETDLDEFRKYEKGNYIKLVQPLLERGQ
jgi:hypothetical protein